jgi:hypothetical protein
VKKLALIPDRLPFRLNLVERVWLASLVAHLADESGKQEIGKKKSVYGKSQPPRRWHDRLACDPKWKQADLRLRRACDSERGLLYSS